MSETVLDVRDLQVEFFTGKKSTIAVDKISFELKPGETIGIVGESGSGKSVTSLAVIGLVPDPGKVTGGEIWFKDPKSQTPVNLLALSEDQRRLYRGGKIAMIFQEPMSSLNPVYNIGFQITEALRQHQSISPSQARREAVARLQEVKLIPSDQDLKAEYLGDYSPLATPEEMDRYINEKKLAILGRYPHELSGGQLQRVMIAMAIACNPSILIADEPTTALDVTVEKTILELLRDLSQARGMAMIFISHDLGVIAEISHSVAVMYQGKVVEYGPLRQILLQPQHPYTKGLLACRPSLDFDGKYLPTVADFMTVAQTPTGELIIEEKNLHLDIETITPEQKTQRLTSLLASDPLISVRNLTVGFRLKGVLPITKRYFMAVNDISFDVYPGETLGLVGESGCGKSTLARTILRLINPLGGQIFFQRENILRWARFDRRLQNLRREVQIIFQNPFSALNPRMTIGKAIMEPLEIHKLLNTKTRRLQRVRELLERVGLNPDWVNRYPHQLSGGQRQRVCIARALAVSPQFIICDESVSALDVSVQAQVLNLLKKLQQEENLTYIFISHDLSVVKFMSDRLMVMNRGHIEELAAAEQIYRDPQSDYTKKLIASIPTGKIE